MNKEKNLLLAKYLRGIARYTLLVVFSLVFIFALLFLVLLFIAWKWELIGGILITLLGFGAMYYFCFPWKGLEFAFYLSLFIIIFGSLFIISWYLRRKANNHRE